MSMSEKQKLQKENRQELWIACRFGLSVGRLSVSRHLI